MKITITRALAELKLLDARIIKKTSEAWFVDVFQNQRNLALRSNLPKEEFQNKAKASLQSIEALIERRKKIKSAILISNATIMVKISGFDYTVIEAIERKNSISYEKSLMLSMRGQVAKLKKEIENQRPLLDKNLQILIEQNYGKEAKPTKEDYDLIADPYLKSNTLNLLDPCKIEKVIEELDIKIDSFLAEVDFILSESNSRTEIEVPESGDSFK